METIQGRKLLKGGDYKRKNGIFKDMTFPPSKHLPFLYEAPEPKWFHISGDLQQLYV